MKFTKHTFLMLGLASMFSVSGIDAAFATACNKKNVAAGKFCHAGGAESDCRPGCYCLGANKEKGVNNGQVDKACEGKWSSPKSELNRVGVQYCPDAFPNSASGAKKETDCYYINPSGKKIYYQKHTCPAGDYLPKNSDTCKGCGDIYTVSSGKYCPGISDIYPSKTSDQGIQTCPSGQVPTATLKACVASTTVTPTTIAPATIAPTTVTPTTIAPATIAPATIAPTTIAPATIAPATIAPIKHCDIGTYLPANSGDCAACTENICAGGTFTVTTYDQGLGQRCVAPEKPNHRTGKCDRDMITCISGTYLPANSPLGTECSPCPNGKLCLGGTFEIMRSIDQGADGTCQGDTIISSSGKECIACEFGKKPNSTHTACVSTGSTTVNPGYFLPKGSTESKKCTSTSKYCPGGTFDPSTSRDQGQFDCPTGSRATDDKSACAVTLTKKQMMYGINGTGGRYSENAVQCWTKTGADYKACMGFKSDGSLVSTSVPGLSINLKPIKAELKPIKAELKQFNLASPLVQAASKDLVTKESPRKD